MVRHQHPPDWRDIVGARLPDLTPAVAEELAQHLGDLYDEARRDGLDHRGAEQLALAALAESADALPREVAAPPDPGPVEAPSRTMAGAARAVRFVFRDAWRSLRATPALTAFIVAVLALGISAATVTFSVVDAVVLRPLPFSDPDQLMVVEVSDEQFASNVTTSPVYLFEQLRAGATTLSDVAAVSRGSVLIATGAEPERIQSAGVTASLFDVLGVAPILGQPFTAENEADGRDDVAVIGYDFWQRHFEGDPNVVGRPLALVDAPVTVLGVMPQGFSYPLTNDRQPEVWTPLVASPDERSGQQLSRYLQVVARLAPGSTRSVAEAEARAILAAAAVGGPASLAGLSLNMRLLADAVYGDVRGWMLLLLAAVALVMVVACANVANLLLARSTRRARELAIRASVGASRRRLLASMLVESVLLSLLGAGLGIAAAWWGVEAARATLPTDIARVSQVALDLRVLGVMLCAGVATGIAFGLMPAWQASRDDIAALLKDGSASATAGRARLRSAFLVAEIAFVALLLVATSLFVGSYVRVATADLGFDRRDLLLASAPGLDVPVTQALDALRATPGVASAGALANGSAPLTLAGNFGGGLSGTYIWHPGQAPSDGLGLVFLRVTPGYFDASGARLAAGRDFTRDELGRSDLMVVDRASARLLFGDDDPIGRTVLYGGGDEARIIGLIDDVRDRGPEAPPTPQVYLPTGDDRGHEFLVRVSGNPAAVVPALSVAFEGLRPAGSPPARIRPLEDAFRFITASRRFAAGLMSLFGVLAVLIGVTGIYGVMSSVVAQRTRDIGIRLALGASRRAVVGGVLGWSARHLLAGLAIGLTVAALAARGFASVFFGVTPADTSIYAIVGAVCLAAGLAATAIPARRATDVDPLLTLRSN